MFWWPSDRRPPPPAVASLVHPLLSNNVITTVDTPGHQERVWCDVTWTEILIRDLFVRKLLGQSWPRYYWNYPGRALPSTRLQQVNQKRPAVNWRGSTLPLEQEENVNSHYELNLTFLLCLRFLNNQSLKSNEAGALLLASRTVRQEWLG